MDDWDLENYSRLQLPHPEHPEEGHASSVYTIQLQGRHLVSGSADHSVRMWDIETQRLARPALLGHSASVLCLQFDSSPQENIVISGSVDTSIIIWRFSTGELLRKISNAHTESVLNLCWDERYLITASKDKTIKIWTRQTVSAQDELIPRFVRTSPPLMDDDLMIMEYSCLVTLKGHQAAVNVVRIKDNRIVSASGDRLILVWNLHSGEVVQRFSMHTKGIACLWLNSRFAVTGSSDQTVRITDLQQECEIARLEGYRNLVRSLQVVAELNGEPSQMVTGSYDGHVKLWQKDIASGIWGLKADLQYGSLQPPLPKPDDPFTEWRKFNVINRVFKVQVAGQQMVCSGEGKIIEGWNFQVKTPVPKP